MSDVERLRASLYALEERVLTLTRERDEAHAQAAAMRAALDECEGGIRSYLGHAGQDADHAFIVEKYLNPARTAWVKRGKP